MSSERESDKLYQHKTKEEMISFMMDVKAKAGTHTSNGENIRKVFKDPTSVPTTDGARETASRQLFDIVILLTGNQVLKSHLGQHYDDDGPAAINYIKGCFNAGENADKQKAASDRYDELAAKTYPEGFTIDAFRADHAEMGSIVKELHGTDLEIKEAKHCNNLVKMVTSVGRPYEIDTLLRMGELSTTNRKSPTIRR